MPQSAEIRNCRVTGNLQYPDDLFELELECGSIAARAKPGQFVNISGPDRSRTILRRPFSIARKHRGRIRLLIKQAGTVTRAIADLKRGSMISVFGPLGNGFTMPRKVRGRIFLVAGGHGIAGITLLTEHLARIRNRADITVIWGGRKASSLAWRRYLGGIKGIHLRYATDDGSLGFKGTSVELLKDLLGKGNDSCSIYACGPMAMLDALWNATRDESMQVAVEERMACGYGVCQGCVVPIANADGNERYARACKEGPVFRAGNIDWKACRF